MSGNNQTLSGPDLKKGLRVGSLKPGTKLLGHADGKPVLIVNDNGKIFAVGALCSHYSGDLSKGIIVHGSIRCPLHHACFDLETGNATKAPALSPIPAWDVEVSDGMIYVRNIKAVRSKAADYSGKEHFVIIGSGAAGQAAAEKLRQEQFNGSITILSEDTDLPYDRPNLSKDFLAGNAPDEWMTLRSEEFYKENKIKILLNTKVEALLPGQKKIVLSDGKAIRFNKCLIATGGSPFVPPIPGIDSANVYFLRSFENCKALIRGLTNVKKVAIVGAGFIGLESAAALKSRGLEVIVIAPTTAPLGHVLGLDTAAFLKSVHEKNGVQFMLGRSVEKIERGHIKLSDGNSISSDLVLIATGIKPNTEIAERASLKCKDGIVVNEYLETSEPGIFAAGDVAVFPKPQSKELARIEHWAVAQRQGQIAAINMLGGNQTYSDVPFFWSQQFDVTINFVGFSNKSAQTKVYGSFEQKNCAVTFSEGSNVTAVLTIGRDEQSLQVEKAMEDANQVKIQEILKGPGSSSIT